MRYKALPLLLTLILACFACDPSAPAQDSGEAATQQAQPKKEKKKADAKAPKPSFVAVPHPKNAPFEEGTVIRLAEARHAEIVGIETVVASRSEVGLTVRATASVQFDQDAVAEVRAPVRGLVREVLAELGEKVEAGAPLFVLASAEVGDLQAGIRAAREESQTAQSNYERQRDLARDGIASARKVELARQQAQAAQSRLASMQSSLRIAGAANRNGELVVRAPIAGTVVRRPAVVGTAADPSTPLATIADASKMWAIIDVPERDAVSVSVGQPVSLELEGREKPAVGTVAWISPEIDPRTRTVTVRAKLDNADGQLRANQFAEAVIGIAPREDAVVVPIDAVQRIEDFHVAFVEQEPGVYEPRVVRLGLRGAGELEIRAGLGEGEKVVVEGSFVLKTELLPDSIGAGCCEVPGEGGE